MKKVLAINCCFREESRTKRIYTPVINCLETKYSVEEIDLSTVDCQPADRQMLKDRENGIVPDEMVMYASKIASADIIVIAAPFWDMSFPAKLKVFFENTSLFNVTFTDNGTNCTGLCKCQHLIYITTRGMDISVGDALEQATPYLKALSWLWDLGEIHVIDAQNLDYSSEETIDEKIDAAIKKGLELCEKL